MRHRTPVLLLCLALLTAPGALAHASQAAAEVAPPGTDCSGAVDFACFHIDCTRTFCVRMVCLVYIGHAGHQDPPGFGCTPP